MTAVMAAARAGDRHTHAGRTQDHGGALLSVAAGALVAASGGGTTTAVIGAGAASGGGASITTREVIPNGTSGQVAKGSPRTFLGNGRLPAALAGGEPLDCHHHRDNPIRTGSASVFVDGLRLARQADETTCGAMICDGEKTVLVGGAPADGAPPDPLVLVTEGQALASIAVGAAIGVGREAVAIAQRWGEALQGQVIAVVDEGAASAGAAAAQLGALVGEVGAAASGAQLGADLFSAG